jgi:hypothetical protein
MDTSRRGGFSLLGAVFCIFLVLKLIHKIDWSWWWVTAPIWVPALIIAVVGAFAAIYIIVTERWNQ